MTFDLSDAMRRLAPKYWRDETSGRLRETVDAYLSGRKLTTAEIGLLRWYLHQWVSAPIWKANPHGVPEDFDELVRSAETLSTREEISRWIHRALDFGIDPF